MIWRSSSVSEYAAEMYVDDQLDGQGMPTSRGLTRGVKGVTLDTQGSVSGLIRFDSHYDHVGQKNIRSDHRSVDPHA